MCLLLSLWLWSMTVYPVSLLSDGKFTLPDTVKPKHYDLMFTFDLDPKTNFSFYGVVHISLTPKEATTKIVLHSNEHSICKDRVAIKSSSSSPKISGIHLEDQYNFLTISLDASLQIGQEYVLIIPFFGNLKMGLDGVYISTYTDKQSADKEYLVTTQFEAISARKGFPCFDEPLKKATFRITIGHHVNYTAASNMPLASTSPKNALEEYWPWSKLKKTIQKQQSEFTWDTFMNSLPMSTYLVAFVVSKFGHVASNMGNITFRIWARKDAISQASYAAEIGPKVLKHYENYFNVSFPLPKIDMFSIPDFNAGAMENWGLITYKETNLLFDAQQSSLLNRGKIAELISHELAHQWFGNLVTMKWWADLWLNEGFATYMSYGGVSAVEPSWMHNITHALEDILTLLSADSLKSSHPVSTTLEDPKQILTIFDTISYKKGATLIRMMCMLIGEKRFRAALNNYIVKYSYSNAEQDDLWRELNEVSQGLEILEKTNIKSIMDTWTKQTGYPLINATRNYEKKSMLVAQARYLSLLDNPPKTRSDPSWWVPLSIITEDDKGQGTMKWLTESQAHDTIKVNAEEDSWVLLNYNMIAPIRVNYDARNWDLLTKTLNSANYTTIPIEARVQLLTDALDLAWIDEIDYGIALKVVSYLQRETNYVPISTAIQALTKIEDMLKRSEKYGAFQKFGRRLIDKTYKEVEGCWHAASRNDNNILRVRLEVLTVKFACRVQVVGCEENAITLYKQWMEASDPDSYNPIPLDLRRVVYCTAIERGGLLEWRFAVARKKYTNVAGSRDALLAGLTCTKDVSLIKTLLHWIVDKNSDLRPHEATSVLMGILKSSVGYYVAKDFVYSRILDLQEVYQGQMVKLGFVMMSILSQFTTQEELDEFQKWSEQHKSLLDNSKALVNQGIEKAKVNIFWMSKNSDTIVEKMRENSGDFDDPMCDIINKSRPNIRSSSSTLRSRDFTAATTIAVLYLILR